RGDEAKTKQLRRPLGVFSPGDSQCGRNNVDAVCCPFGLRLLFMVRADFSFVQLSGDMLRRKTSSSSDNNARAQNSTDRHRLLTSTLIPHRLDELEHGLRARPYHPTSALWPNRSKSKILWKP
ncbi:Hypothetical protein SMAX5B_015108, partial [Scophthalmus maximus]